MKRSEIRQIFFFFPFYINTNYHFKNDHLKFSIKKNINSCKYKFEIFFSFVRSFVALAQFVIKNEIYFFSMVESKLS